MENQEALATILTMENGKPLVESRAEIAYGASFIRWFAEEAKRVYGEVIPFPSSNSKKLLVTHHPVGVAAMVIYVFRVYILVIHVKNGFLWAKYRNPFYHAIFMVQYMSINECVDYTLELSLCHDHT